MPLKIATVLGTRPEIVRLCRIIEKLDRLCTHILVHTGQNYDPNLSDVFFRDLAIRSPDYYLGVKAATFGGQAAQILTGVEEVLAQERPDRLLVLGDTNSGLSVLVAKRMGVQVYHMEAGNRCFARHMAEEVNRRVIDHASDVLLPYAAQGRENLLREGIPPGRILVTGNPIGEVLEHHRPQIDRSDALRRLGLDRGGYFLATVHRAENVDVGPRLRGILDALQSIQERYGRPVVCSLHPRTRSRMAAFGLEIDKSRVRFLDPLGFFDFVALQRGACCVLTDSGTVQEECCLLRVPNVTLRIVTERPETMECGSNLLAGPEPAAIADAVATALALGCRWSPPAEYLKTDVSDAVVKILLGHECDLAG